jgi:FkbM family methyltransferase
MREQTLDRLIVDSVLSNNEYSLPERTDGWVVVDVGAHIGAFSRAVLDRGAKTVWAVEPDPENFALLVENLVEPEERDAVLKQLAEASPIPGEALVLESGRVVMIRAAVLAHPSLGMGLRRLTNHDLGDARNTGHVDIFGPADGTVTIGLDELLKQVRKNDSTRYVDFLKIDAEGAEWSILEESELDHVRRLTVETHEVPAGEHPMLYRLHGMSLQDLAESMKTRLERLGFNANHILTLGKDVDGKDYELGKLVAERKESRASARAEDADERPSLLWVGDAAISTGFARVTREVIGRLQTLGWRVGILGIGYNGDPHPFPYPIYPTDMNDFSGINRVAKLSERLRPDLIVIQNDSWNVAAVLERAILSNVWTPFVGYVAVDAENVRTDVGSQLRNLKLAICHTEFGREQLRKAGYMNDIAIIPHGVDTSVFRPCEKEPSRETGGLGGVIPRGAFLWGAVNANQPRKRLDLTIAYFAAWWHKAGRPKDAYLYIHADKADSGMGAWDLGQICDHCGVHARVIRTKLGTELQENQMPVLYSFFDAQLSTAEGESFGLTHLEGMACGVPQIAQKCAGLADWAKDAIRWVEPGPYVFTPNFSNSRRRIVMEEPFVAAMDELYQSAERRAEYREKGLALAKEMSWNTVAARFDTELRAVLQRTKRRTAEAWTDREQLLKEF